MAGEKSQGEAHCDVLVVGAGPTGLALAAQLLRFGVRPLIIDKGLDRAQESRALAVQPRTLEVLRSLGLGLADQLIRRGNPATRMRIVAGHSTATVKLFDIGLDDTSFPYLLFVSQAQTEAVLADHLAAAGVQIRRGVALERCLEDGGRLACTLRRPDGSKQVVSARYVVGCDGAHSTVRTQAGMPFVGASYPQTFVLADLAADGLEPDTVHAYVTDTGPLLFFPLVDPAPWRVITVRRPVGDNQLSDDVDVDVNAAPVSLAELQAAVDAGTGGRVRVRDAVWMTAFRLHHRHAARYRSGRAFVAGDAAHVHSPAGAQGMNTGIQDAANLGWKLALVCHGVAPDDLLDSYDAERRPVGEFVLRFTDRAFTAVTSGHPLVRAVRTRVVPRVLPLVLRFRAGRAAAFRTVSQLGVAYPRSPAVEGTRSRRTRGAQPGDRLPDARVVRDGEPLWLHEALTGPTYHLLLCGPVASWDRGALAALAARHDPLVETHHLAQRPGQAELTDRDGHALARLRVAGWAQLVIRPDGHIGYRADHSDLGGAARYLARWLARPEQSDQF